MAAERPDATDPPPHPDSPPHPEPAGLTVRDATAADAAACAAIYAPYVTGSAVSFEELAPTPSEMAERIAAAQAKHAWLVAEQGARVLGYAYGGPFRGRAAYRWSVEVSVYLDSGVRRTGAGRALYTALLDRLRERGYRTAVAGMTVPNTASEGLHRALGFEPVGTFHRIGFKDGRWHDVAWFELDLRDGGAHGRTETRGRT